MRRYVIAILAFLVIALPINSMFSDQASAASSRVAIIKELKGTVKVKKSGGSKEFTAFAKMSLNEGDVLMVGDNGSAVLQFSNGTSEDDRMTVTANAKLTFSKLSSKSGTTTKVSMWSGKAWVDVKSITSNSDQFTLETPTSVMGVRGTHLFVSIDPLTQLTQLTVAAGIVRTVGKSGDQQPVDVYPAQQVVLSPDGQGPVNDQQTTIDLNELVNQSDPSIVAAFLRSLADIQEENDRLMQEYHRQLSDLPADARDRLQSNIENFIGAYVDQAIQQGLVTQQQVNELVEEAERSTGQKFDLSKKTITLTDEERRVQEEQRRLQEQLKQQAEEKRRQEQQAREAALRDKLAELEKQREQLEQQRREALQKQQQQAREQYEALLTQADKERFARDSEERAREQSTALASNIAGQPPQNATPISTPDQGSSQGQYDLTLSSLRLYGAFGEEMPSGEPGSSPHVIELSPSFSPTHTSYAANVSSSVTYVYVKPVAANAASTEVYVNDSDVIGSGQGYWVPLFGDENHITVTVHYANSDLMNLYMITIFKQQAYGLELSRLQVNGDDIDLIPNILFYEHEVYDPVVTITPTVANSDYEVQINPEPIEGDHYLNEGWNYFTIEVADGTDWTTYTLGINYMQLPLGISEWSTIAELSYGDTVPIYWTLANTGEITHFYGRLPQHRGTVDSVTFSALLEGEAVGKFTHDDQAPYEESSILTLPINEPTDYNVIDLTMSLGSEPSKYRFHLVSTMPAPEGINVEYQEGEIVEAEWVNGAFYVMLPGDAEDIVKLYALAQDDADLYTWHMGEAIVPQEIGYVEAEPGQFDAYFVQMENAVGLNLFYPVFIYRGLPQASGSPNPGVSAREGYDGWRLNVVYEMPTDPEATAVWAVEFTPLLTSEYEVVLYKWDGNVFYPSEGRFVIDGIVGEGPSPEIYFVQVMDGDIPLARYTLEIFLAPIYNGGTISP